MLAFPEVFKRCQQAKQTGVDIYFSLGLLQKGAPRPLRLACCEDSSTGVCINLQQYRHTKMQNIHRKSLSARLILWRRCRSSSTYSQRCQSPGTALCVAKSQTAAGVEDTGLRCRAKLLWGAFFCFAPPSSLDDRKAGLQTQLHYGYVFSNIYQVHGQTLIIMLQKAFFRAEDNTVVRARLTNFELFSAFFL